MTPLANGRIVLWEGGSLWLLRVPTPPPGAPQRTDFHAHHAIQIALALDGSFLLYGDDQVLKGPAVMVAADARHAFEPRGLIALLFIEPESTAGRALSEAAAPGLPVSAVSQALLGDLPAELCQAFSDPTDDDERIRDIGRRLIRQLSGGADIPPPDPRVKESIAWAAGHLDRRLSIADAAARVRLSVDRMSHLFVEQTGLPFRTYVLWLRISKALELYAAGASLTEAAHEAGFADSAHFSRTFRRMFGVAAAELRFQ